MNIEFNKIEINNFLSFGSATVSLNNRNYTLVKGINENPDDVAKSNGSGKSTIFEAISWCLTGTTIRGCKDVTNLNGDDGALVILDFNINNNNYVITRSKDHSKFKTNLKIFINGEDKSGKGIRDSEKLLEEYIPDLNGELLGSVIILGQGLPQRFTNNTPSGRKEVLEKLSKSDFMIEDLKERISTRKLALQEKSKDLDLRIANANGQISSKNSEYESISARLDELNSLTDLDEKINLAKSNLSILTKQNKELIDTQSSLIDTLNDNKVALEQSKANQIKEISAVNDKFYDKLNTAMTAQKSHEIDANYINNEIVKLENIKDVCPTCGHKLEGVEKPDTSELHTKFNELKELVCKDTDQIKNINNEINVLKTNINNKYQLELDNFNSTIKDINSKLNELKPKITQSNSLVEDAEKLLNQLNTQKVTKESKIDEYTSRLIELKDELSKLSIDIDTGTKEKIDSEDHLSVVNKMNNIITRDFRGYLLSNIIDYINNKAKEYSNDIFDTDKIEFIQDGNNISISYDNKSYENLSGGEKQKVDIIVQFAIRDMLCKYLNFSSNILVLDEIFDNLDDIGCQKVLNLISKKLNDVNSIFIVTHHSDISIPTDNIILVKKGIDKISRIVNG